MFGVVVNKGESVDQMPDIIKPVGIARKANEADAERRLELVYSKGHQKHSRCNAFVESGAGHNRLEQMGNLAAVFAHEVANPLSGLSASLQFALQDLAGFALHDSRTDRDISILQGTLQGALREVDRLVELLDDFRWHLATKASSKKNRSKKNRPQNISFRGHQV